MKQIEKSILDLAFEESQGLQKTKTKTKTTTKEFNL